MSIRTVSKENGVGQSSGRRTEDQQVGPRSRSQSRRTTASPPLRNVDEVVSAVGEGSRHSNSRATNNDRPQNTTDGQSHQMEGQSQYMSPAYRTRAALYADPSSIPPPSQAMNANSINDPIPASWQGYFNEMPLEMYASPEPFTAQHLATPRMQPIRGNSLPTPQVAYSPMYPSQTIGAPQSTPHSYRSLSASAPSPYAVPMGAMQSTLPNAQSQQLYPQSVPVIPVNPYPSQPAADTTKDAFVASDPFHPHSLAKGEKEISSFDDIEMPAPSRYGGSVPQGSTVSYANQAAAYGWPDGRASDMPGSSNLPASAQDGGWGTGALQNSHTPWGAVPYGRPYAQRMEKFESLNSNENTQYPPTPAFNHLGKNGHYLSSSDYTGYPTHSSDYTGYPTHSSDYIGYPNDSARRASWYKPGRDSRPTRPNGPSSRISSWGSYPDHTPSASYSTPYGTPAVPSPSGWGSEYQDDSPSIPPTHTDELGHLEDSSKTKIKMPEPYIPQIIPSNWESSPKTRITMPEPHIPQIIPVNRRTASTLDSDRPTSGEITTNEPTGQHIAEPPAMTSAEPTQKPSGSIAIGRIVSSYDELWPIRPNEESAIIIPTTDSPKSDLSYLPGNTTTPLTHPTSQERLDSTDENVAEETGNDHGQTSPASERPVNRPYFYRAPSPTTLPSPSLITMPIPQIPLIIPPRPYFETRPVDPTDLPVPRPASKHSSSESISKPEPSSPAKSSFSSWSMPSSFPPVTPYTAHGSSLWTKTKNFFRWPFSDSELSSPKPQYAPNYIPTPLPTPYILPPPPAPMVIRYTKDSSIDMTKILVDFVTGTLPSQVYLHFLLRLPSLYFSRVARIFEEADLSLPEIKKMALETASTAKGPLDMQFFESSNMPLQYTRLKSTWEGFIDSVMREWKTFNIISVLLLSAILTILQIDSAADDPITRYTAIASLICALISLLFGCMYIIRFGSMRKTYKAAEWALEAKRSKTVIWWNVWVLLAMPAIWLTWSIILYIACTMSFVWRTSSQSDAEPIVTSKTALLTVRIVISSVLGLGLIYGGLILTTFSRYGSVMDKAWKKRVDNWIVEKHGLQGQSGQYMSTPHYGSSYYHTPYMRPATNPLPPGFVPESYTPYVQPASSSLPPGFVPQTFTYPFRGSTPYGTPTWLLPSTSYTPFIPPANIPPYGPYPPVVPPYSPFIPPVVPSTPATPFIPPLDTPSSDSVDLPYVYGMPSTSANYYSRQSSARRRTNSSDIAQPNNPRRNSRNERNYITPNISTPNARSMSSSDIDSVTRSNTQHNAAIIPDHTSPNTGTPSNPTSARRGHRRPTVSVPSPPPPTQLSPASGIEAANANDTSQSVDTPSPVVQSPGDTPDPSSAHVHFRSPLHSAASNQGGVTQTVSTVDADDSSSPDIRDSSRRDSLSGPYS